MDKEKLAIRIYSKMPSGCMHAHKRVRVSTPRRATPRRDKSTLKTMHMVKGMELISFIV
jgi:hypothetical protein